MAIIARTNKRKNKNGKFVEIKHPPINRRIIEEATVDGILPYAFTKEIFDTYMDFGFEVTLKKEVWKIPYVGTMKPKIVPLLQKEEKIKF